MAHSPEDAFPFNLSDIAKDMQDRFGWQDSDLAKAMSQLLAASQTGFKHFGPPSADVDIGSWMTGQVDTQKDGSAFDPTGLFFGPKTTQQQLANQIASATGLQQDAVAEMMPVAATLAMGNKIRPYLGGQAQTLLDAFLRGFARGRPKPPPSPTEVFQGYQEAVTSFWSSFLTPSSPDNAAQKQPEPEPVETGNETFPIGDKQIADWMSMGKELQASQFKAFEELFQKASSSVKPNEGE